MQHFNFQKKNMENMKNICKIWKIGPIRYLNPIKKSDAKNDSKEFLIFQKSWMEKIPNDSKHFLHGEKVNKNDFRKL